MSIDSADIDSALATYGASLSGTVAAASVYATPGAGPAPRRSDWACTGTGWADGTAVAFFESTDIANTNPTDARCVHWITFDAAGAVDATTGRTLWNAQLLAKAFRYDDKIMVPLLAPSDIDAVLAETWRPESDGHWAANAEAWICELESASSTELRRVAVALVDVSRRPGFQDSMSTILGRIPRTSLVSSASSEFAFGAPTNIVDLTFSGGDFPPQHSADIVYADLSA
jgi:hypothetical protein